MNKLALERQRRLAEDMIGRAGRNVTRENAGEVTASLAVAQSLLLVSDLLETIADNQLSAAEAADAARKELVIEVAEAMRDAQETLVTLVEGSSGVH